MGEAGWTGGMGGREGQGGQMWLWVLNLGWIFHFNIRHRTPADSAASRLRVDKPAKKNRDLWTSGPRNAADGDASVSAMTRTRHLLML